MKLLDFLAFLIFISFLIRTFRNVFYNVFLWQLKEYRVDRLITHLKTTQGKKLIFGYLTIIKWFLFFGILADAFFSKGLLFETNIVGGIYFYLFWLIWVFEASLNIREMILYRWRLPRLTVKTIFILVSSLFIIFYPIFSFDSSLFIAATFFVGPIIDRFLGLTIAIVILFFNVPAFIYKRLIVFFAREKISNLPKLQIIGITGSYGKTSTKEFLATILSEKFKVAKTPEFTNTDIGIANYILKELKPEHKIFVVEMGAYKKGEIKDICEMVRPKIGIITGINEQHLELFGTLEDTMKTKFELIESLPKGATAIFNGNNFRCFEMAKWAEISGAKPIIFKTRADVKNIKLLKDHIEFNFTFKNKTYLMKANLLGIQTIENILPAIYAAKSLGMSIVEIQKGVAKITSPAKTMQIAGSKNGSTFIDDTFNANPDGVIAAVDYMKQYKGKKVLVLTPLIELGGAADKIHREIGEKASKICDLILITNINYRKSFIDGAKKTGKEKKIQIINTSVGTKLIEDNLTKDGVVVFEGKEAGRILEKLLHA